MALFNSTQSYGSLAKLFHWTIALLIIAMLAIGFIMTSLANTPDKFKLYGLHKSIGITILLLVLLRLGWKFANVRPLYDPIGKWAKYLANITHGLLYVLMLAMPLSGWAMSSAAGMHVSVFGWFTMFDLVGSDKALGKLLRQWHGNMAWLLIGLVTLHIAAAFLHHFYYRDNVLRRMLPFVRGVDA